MRTPGVLSLTPHFSAEGGEKRISCFNGFPSAEQTVETVQFPHRPSGNPTEVGINEMSSTSQPAKGLAIDKSRDASLHLITFYANGNLPDYGRSGFCRKPSYGPFAITGIQSYRDGQFEAGKAIQSS